MAMFPFLTIQARSLGITEKELGIVYAFTPAITIIGPPLTGMIADKIGNFKVRQLLFYPLYCGYQHFFNHIFSKFCIFEFSLSNFFSGVNKTFYEVLSVHEMHTLSYALHRD
ncbi:hypothetical protein E2C01_102166 [Portunus trituberculatus]|uniref:Major facilitator superfamily associated domain-containing protein n=1 Tax=Portunus trituberculatus TaxID=210409 RepID=A0A5B7KLY4_PORTR|nr:hypothetical protein [Portunus trituberculatus]